MSNPALRSSRLPSFFSLITILLPALLFVPPAAADSHARIVRLSYVDGDVQIDKADGRGFGTAYLNMPVTHQSKVWARDGQAEVEFEDGSSVRLTPDTIVGFNDLSLDASGRRNSVVELQQGTAYFDIRHHGADNFELQFGRDRLQSTKSAHFRVAADRSRFEVAMFGGEAQVFVGSDSEIAVKKGETIRFDGDDPDRYYLAKGTDVENYDTWDSARTKGHDEAVSSAIVSGNNGITYGLSDLNSYGNYFYVPGYGYMWRPSSVGLGWDPFADGYWVSYPGYGYTFVSSYPWGWAPYRYGSWQFVNGYGWCWAPGSNWNNWQTFPGIRTRPPHYRPPVVPRSGSPVVAVTHGAALPVPPRQIVVDNDALEHRRPHSSKVVAEDGTVIRQSQPTGVTTQGFTTTTTTSPTTGVIAPMALPGSVTVQAPRQIQPHVGMGRGIDEVRAERGRSDLGQPNQITPAETRAPIVGATSSPSAISAPPANRSAPPTPIVAPVHTDVRGNSPRMESHVSTPAPPMRSTAPMHTETRSGGWSAPAMHSSAPSFSPSAGGGRASGGGSSTGGAHSGGSANHH